MFGRPFLLPGGVAADRVEALRTAFTATMKDAKLLAEADRAKLDISYIGGAELQAIVSKLYSTPENVIAKVKQSLIYISGQR